jgi:hypothetical protein
MQLKENAKEEKPLILIQGIFKAICFLSWIALWALLAEGLASKLGFKRLEKLVFGLWSSLISIGLWLILALK